MDILGALNSLPDDEERAVILEYLHSEKPNKTTFSKKVNFFCFKRL